MQTNVRYQQRLFIPLHRTGNAHAATITSNQDMPNLMVLHQSLCSQSGCKIRQRFDKAYRYGVGGDTFVYLMDVIHVQEHLRPSSNDMQP